MKVESDFVLVCVPNEMNNFCGVVLDEKGNEVQLVLNTRFRPTHNARICAKVIAVNKYLSGADNPLYEKYPGSPKPMSYRGHDFINRYMEQLPEKYRKKEQMPYMCGKYVPQMQTHFGLPIEVEENDLVYFHYNSLLVEMNYMWRLENGDLVYRIHYSQLICRVRGLDIHMLNGNVLVKEVLDSGIKKIEVEGQTITGKMSGDLVVGVDVNEWAKDPNSTRETKKEKPYSYGAKSLKGVLCHIGPSIGEDTRSVDPGALIIFRPSSEFKNNIEGELYFVMKQWDIVAEWIDEETSKSLDKLAIQNGVSVEYEVVKAVGDYVMIEPEVQEVSHTIVTHVFDPSKRVQAFKPGELFVPEGAISQEKKKKIHKFGIGKVISQGETVKNSYAGKRVMFEKSGYYMFNEEYDVVFTRAGDVYGYFEETP